MKKAFVIILLVALTLILLPSRAQYKDGGSVEYRAIAYTVYDVHALYGTPDGQMKFVEGVIIEVFGYQVYNGTEPHIDDFGDSPEI